MNEIGALKYAVDKLRHPGQLPPAREFEQNQEAAGIIEHMVWLKETPRKHSWWERFNSPW